MLADWADVSWPLNTGMGPDVDVPERGGGEAAVAEEGGDAVAATGEAVAGAGDKVGGGENNGGGVGGVEGGGGDGGKGGDGEM